MTCQEFSSIARDYAHAQWLSETQRTQARLHVSACAQCRQRVENEAALSSALGRLRNEQSAMEPPEEIEAALLAAFAARRPQQPRITRRALWWAIPAAAAVLIGAVLALTSPQEPSASTTVAVKEPAPIVQAEPVAEPAPIVASQPRPKLPPRVRSAVAVPERVTDFVALRYGKPLESGEPIRVIRMQMRRSELLRLGLPVAPDAASTFIKADVLLGEDGLAKAIRFVY